MVMIRRTDYGQKRPGRNGLPGQYPGHWNNELSDSKRNIRHGAPVVSSTSLIYRVPGEPFIESSRNTVFLSESKRNPNPPGNDSNVVIDDSTLDKTYSHQIELVTRHWSEKHHRVVQGINLISTIWTDGSAIVPVDFRIYCPDKDGKNKNDHFRDMVRAAEERQFHPDCVIFDSWYSSIDK
jgi:hypothetical protein